MRVIFGIPWLVPGSLQSLPHLAMDFPPGYFGVFSLFIWIPILGFRAHPDSV